MDYTKIKFWQQACGDTNRNYSETCFKWGVILNGPGYAGKYPECNEVLRTHDWSSKKITDIKRFAEEMKDGDIVVLRLGTSEILGVGIIVGNYYWSDFFSDVDGWDLQHVRRVNWLFNFTGSPKKFKTYDLKLGDTTQELTSTDVIDWIKTLSITDIMLKQAIIEIPSVEVKNVNHDEIAEYLFEQGVSSNSIETLIKEFDELRRIAKWYVNKESPSEFETVAYLVVPILRALGWTPQRMAIEWRNVDIALFEKLPREDENLSIVVEAKRKGTSCLTAVGQAEGYAKGKTNCKRLIVTDGLRYGIYTKTGDTYILHAYFNLLSLKDKYPIYSCHGIMEGLKSMTPEWNNS